MSFFQIDRKLFRSSLWIAGTPEEKCLWIYLLGTRDDDGVVRERDIAIAYGAGLPRPVVEAGLRKFSEPDPDSRTGDKEGRRIERTEDGFVRIINHELYYSHDYSTPRWRRWKERKELKGSANVGERLPTPLATKDKDKDNNSVGSVVPTSLSKTREPSSALALAKPDPEVEVMSWSREACDDWISRFGGTAPGGQIGKALLPIVKRHGWEFVRKAWCRYLAQSEAQYASAARFSATFGRWSGLAPDPAPQDDATAHNARVLSEYMRNRPEGDLGAIVKQMPKLRG